MNKLKALKLNNKEESKKLMLLPNYKTKSVLAVIMAFLIVVCLYSPFIVSLVTLFLQYSPVTFVFKLLVLAISILVYFGFALIDFFYYLIILYYIKEEKQKNPEYPDENTFNFTRKDIFIDDLTNISNICISLLFPVIITLIIVFL